MSAKEVESLQHTNRIQAEELALLRETTRVAKLREKQMEVERDMARLKHRGLLSEFRAFKALIRHLGATGTEIEWSDGVRDDG